MKIYLAGPMRGIPAYNHPAFDHAALLLRSKGHEVFSPAEEDRRKWPGRDWYALTGDLKVDGFTGGDMREIIFTDLHWISDNADAIALLLNWERSKGVAVERALADFLGITVKPWRELL